MNRSNIPHLHVGMRTVKTVVVVFLSLCLAYVRQGFANPLYIAIAAILCIQPTMESSRIAGTNRLIGTFVGGFWGIAVFLINSYVFADLHIIAKYAFTSLALIPMIYTNIYIKRASMVATSAVVYLIITVSPMAVNRVRLPSEEELSAKKDAMKKRMEPENRNADLSPSDDKKQ